MTENMATSSDDGCIEDSRKEEIAFTPNDSASSRKSDMNASFLRAARAGNLEKLLSYIDCGTDINASNANGLNALHLASKEGHSQVVEELLNRAAAVDAATKKGNTALHIAALAGQLEILKILVGHGSKVNIQSQNGFTALYMAAQENHVDVVRYLLTNSANQTLTTEDGFTPLAVALQQGHDKIVKLLLENDSGGKVHLPALHIAAKKDDVKAANLLLQNAHNIDKTAGNNLANDTTKSGFTPLHIAAHYGNVNVANLLIQKGADVNFKARNSIMPLHVAAKWGRSGMITVLLENGAVIDCQTRDGLTPLHCGARSGHDQVVDLLLEQGAPVLSKTKNGLTPIHMAVQGDHIDCIRLLLLRQAAINDVTIDYLTPLHVAAHCGNVKSAKLLLDRKCEVNARALNGFTPLHIACKKNRIKVVELLLKYGAMMEATTESGLTPMHVASFMGHINIVLHFIQHGACIDSTTVRGETALHLAARANQTDVMRVLLRNGAQVDAKARELQTALHIASRLGNIDNVALLLKHGASPDAVTKDLYTALHIAAKEGHEDVIVQLLEQGANNSLTTKKGFTALHIAAKHGHLRTARLLLKRGVDANIEGRNGLTPLHVATHYSHISVALMLMENGADPCCIAKNGYTPLHISAKKNQMDIAPTLLDYGAKPNADSKNGFTPLHLAVQNGHVDMVMLLLERGAEVNWRAKNGLTPLHLAAQEDAVPIAELMAKFDLQIDPHTKAGYTPLHTACHFGQINMIRFLLEHGANINAKTKLDYTPLHHAAQQGHVQVINLLTKYGASPDAVTTTGQTSMSIAERLGYLSVVEILRPVTAVTVAAPTANEEKYRVISPEIMQEAPMSDSEDEGAENIVEPSDQLFQYLSSGEMKILQDDSVALDKGDRDFFTFEHRERKHSATSSLGPRTIREELKYMRDEEEAVKETVIMSESAVHHFSAYSSASSPHAYDNVDHHCAILSKLKWKSFLISFMVDARGGAMHGCRHGGVRVIVPPGQAVMPTRITCKLVRKERLLHPPPLMDGEALASRILEVGPAGTCLLGPIVIEVPHFAALRGEEREIAIMRSDNGQTWREHTYSIADDNVQELIDCCFDELKDGEYQSSTMARIVTKDFPLYFAVVTRSRLNTAIITPSGGVVSSKVVPQVQAVFPPDAVVRSTKVALQVVPVSPELVSRLLGSNRVAVSPLVTLEPRRRKFHQPVMLTVPLPKAFQRGMINQYSSSSTDQSNLRLLCSVFGTDTFAYLAGDSSTVDHSPTKYRAGGTTSVQWEDITNNTPFTLVNDCVSFTTNISARFWLVDCQNVYDAIKMASELYQELVAVPFLSKFVVFAKRDDQANTQLRLFCMTDDKMDKTLEGQEQFTEIARSREIEVLEDRPQYIEMFGNLLTLTKSGEQPFLMFHSFHENRLALHVKTKDPHQESIGRVAFYRDPRAARGDHPQTAICNLNIHLPDVEDSMKSRETEENDHEVDHMNAIAEVRMDTEMCYQSSKKAATYLDSNFDALQDEIGSFKELGSSRDSSMQRGLSLDVSYDEHDMIKESESMADETGSEAGSVIERDYDDKEQSDDATEALPQETVLTPVNSHSEELKDECDQAERELQQVDELTATPGELSPVLADMARSDPLVENSVKEMIVNTTVVEKEDDTGEELTDRSDTDEWEMVDNGTEHNSNAEKFKPSSEELVIPQSLPEPEYTGDVQNPYESDILVVRRTSFEDSHGIRDAGYTVQRHVVRTQHMNEGNLVENVEDSGSLVGMEIEEELMEIAPRLSFPHNENVDLARTTEESSEQLIDVWVSNRVTRTYINSIDESKEQTLHREEPSSIDNCDLMAATAPEELEITPLMLCGSESGVETTEADNYECVETENCFAEGKTAESATDGGTREDLFVENDQTEQDEFDIVTNVDKLKLENTQAQREMDEIDVKINETLVNPGNDESMRHDVEVEAESEKYEFAADAEVNVKNREIEQVVKLHTASDTEQQYIESVKQEEVCAESERYEIVTDAKDNVDDWQMKLDVELNKFAVDGQADTGEDEVECDTRTTGEYFDTQLSTHVVEKLPVETVDGQADTGEDEVECDTRTTGEYIDTQISKHVVEKLPVETVDGQADTGEDEVECDTRTTGEYIDTQISKHVVEKLPVETVDGQADTGEDEVECDTRTTGEYFDTQLSTHVVEKLPVETVDGQADTGEDEVECDTRTTGEYFDTQLSTHVVEKLPVETVDGQADTGEDEVECDTRTTGEYIDTQISKHVVEKLPVETVDGQADTGEDEVECDTRTIGEYFDTQLSTHVVEKLPVETVDGQADTGEDEVECDTRTIGEYFDTQLSKHVVEKLPVETKDKCEEYQIESDSRCADESQLVNYDTQLCEHEVKKLPGEAFVLVDSLSLSSARLGLDEHHYGITCESLMEGEGKVDEGRNDDQVSQLIVNNYGEENILDVGREEAQADEQEPLQELDSITNQTRQSKAFDESLTFQEDVNMEQFVDNDEVGESIHGGIERAMDGDYLADERILNDGYVASESAHNDINVPINSAMEDNHSADGRMCDDPEQFREETFSVQGPPDKISEDVKADEAKTSSMYTKLESMHEATSSQWDESSRVWGLSVPRIDLQAASPVIESPSSDNELTAIGTCATDNMTNAQQIDTQVNDVTDDGDLDQCQRKVNLNAGSDSEEHDVVEVEANVMESDEMTEDFMTVNDRQQAGDVESDAILETRIIRHNSTKVDELEDKLKSLSLEDDPHSGTYYFTDNQSAGELISPDERDSPDFFKTDTSETCAMTKSSSVDDQQAIAMEEIAEDLIKPSEKLPINFTEKLINVFDESDQYSTYHQEDCHVDTPEVAHGFDDPDDTERFASTVEEEQIEGRISTDTSQQIFIGNMIEKANRSEASTSEPKDGVRGISDSTIGGIALGFDDEELREEERSARGGLPFGMLDPRSPEPPPGSFSYASDLHVGSSDKVDDESELHFSSNDFNNDGRLKMSSPRFLVESPPELLSPSREIALKDELSPVTEHPIVCRKKMAIGSSPSGFILEEDEEEELQQAEAQRGYFRPIVPTISSDQTDSEAEECNPREELDEKKLDSECESETEKVVTERDDDDGERDRDSDEATSPFDVITNDDLVGYADLENELSEPNVVDSRTLCAQPTEEVSVSNNAFDDVQDDEDDETVHVE